MPNYERWMNMTGALNGVPQIPGDGEGSRLARVVGPLTLTVLTRLTATLSAFTSIQTGQLLLTTDGCWGTIAEFPDTVDAGSFTTQNAAETLTSVGHGIIDTTEVILYQVGTNTIPAPLVAGKVYFVVGAAADTLQLSLTSGGAAINITGADTTVGLRTITTRRVRVHEWRNASARLDWPPAGGANSVNVFPEGSCLAGMQSARILRVVPLASTGVTTMHLLDHRLATGTPILLYNNVVGVLSEIACAARVSSPFACQIATVASFDCAVFFEILS